jgi:hypothetical protein
LGAAVAATAAVTFGSAGIASAVYCADEVGCVTAQVVNNTGYTVYSSGGTTTANQPLASGSTLVDDAVAINTTVIYTFTMPENADTAASSWTLTYEYAAGSFPNGYGWSSGSAPSPGSFGTSTIIGGWKTEELTLGGNTHSFANEGGNCKNCFSLDVTDSTGRVNYASETPSNTRGTIIVVNEKPMKIWNPRTNPLRGLAAKLTAPASPVAAVSPVSSTLPAQPQSVAKTATPHRAAARR